MPEYRTTYRVAALGHERDRHFLTEGAAVVFAASQAAASFHTPQWLVARVVQDVQTRTSVVAEYAYVDEHGSVIRRHTPAA